MRPSISRLAGGWRMAVDAIPHGLRVTAYEGARPFAVLAEGTAEEAAHEWYLRYGLAREAERGLDAVDDNLHAGTLRIALAPGASVTVVLSSEDAPSVEDVLALAPPVLRHRMAVSFAGRAEGITVAQVIDQMAMPLR